MSNSSGIITRSVRTREDVRRVLGATDTTLSKLCTHQNINKWSLHKPVKHPSVSPLSEADRRSVNYGFAVTPYYSLNEAWTNRGKAWEYIRPDKVCRIGDFDGYDHNVESLLPGVYLMSNSAMSGGSINLNIDGLLNILDWAVFDYNKANPNLQLGLITSNGYYFPFSGSGGQTIENLGDHPPFPLPSSIFSTNVTYQCIPVLTTFNPTAGQWTTDNTQVRNTWYVLPVPVMEFRVTAIPNYAAIITMRGSGTYTTNDGINFSNLNLNFTATMPSSHPSGAIPTGGNLELIVQVERVLSGNNWTTLELGRKTFQNFNAGSSVQLTIQHSGFQLVSNKDSGLQVNVIKNFTYSNSNYPSGHTDTDIVTIDI